MNDAMILAPTVTVGEKYADANGIPRRNVVTPRTVDRVRGRSYGRLIVVDAPPLKRGQAAVIVSGFIDSPHYQQIAHYLLGAVEND